MGVYHDTLNIEYKEHPKAALLDKNFFMPYVGIEVLEDSEYEEIAEIYMEATHAEYIEDGRFQMSNLNWETLEDVIKRVLAGGDHE